ncbi:MAG TPA: hypothetical protein VIV57_09920 [Anaeromyxobacter sp.]
MTRMNSGMARWLIAAALAFAAPSALAQGVVAQTLSDGAVGALYGRDAARTVTAYATQSRSPTTGQAETFLFFEIDEPYSGFPWGTTNVLFGSGLIPNADLQSDGLGKLVLDTDTSSNPAFTTYACPNPPNPEPPYCIPVENAGRVQMTLSHSSAMPVFHENGQWTFDFGNVQLVQTGTGELGSATGEGSVAGFPFPAGATGSIGTNREVVVVIQQGP